MNGQGGSYMIKEDQSGVELVHRGGTEALVNGRAEDEEKRPKPEADLPTEDAQTSASGSRRRLAPQPTTSAGESSGN
jgi:hypothetical protein